MTWWGIVHGDALDVLRTVESNSCDGLFLDPPSGMGFMQSQAREADPEKNWDSNKGGRDQWIAWLQAIMVEALRALKPGAYGFVWAYPTKAHWTAMALEGAGFRIVHKIFHLVGNRQPKNFPISSEMDKRDGVRGPVIGQQILTGNAAVSLKDKGGTYGVGVGSAPSRVRTLYGPGSEESTRWFGHGTAIRTLAEEWILVQKPIEGSYIANASKWGTGGIGINGCRNGDVGGTRKVGGGGPSAGVYGDGLNGGGPEPIADGRWPCDVILAPDVASELDAAVGDRPSTLTGRADPTKRHANPGDNHGTSAFGGGNSLVYADGGGPSRYYHVYERMADHPGYIYTRKECRENREAGCYHIPVETPEEATGRKAGSVGIQNGRAGTGRSKPRHNDHKTLKALELTEHLARLILPPPRIDGIGRRLLNPFAGSGSEAIGAIFAGWEFVLGVELRERAAIVARARCAHWQRRLEEARIFPPPVPTESETRIKAIVEATDQTLTTVRKRQTSLF